MHTREIVGSLRALEMPAGHEAALLARILREADSARTAPERDAAPDGRTAPAQTETVSRRAVKRGRLARRTLVAALIASALLLAACAAAIYWSSAQKAKQNAAAERNMPEDELRQQAEAYAEEFLSALPLTAPLTGSATVGDVTLALHTVEVFQDTDGAEYVFTYSVESDNVGFVTSFSEDVMSYDKDAAARLSKYETFCELGMDARDFVLTIDSRPFSPYASPDYEGVRQPASNWTEPSETQPYTSTFRIWQTPFSILDDAEMNLSGTLYSCDRTGKRIGTLGDFSIDFDYRYPHEFAEQKRAETTAAYMERSEASSDARLETLNSLPEAATPLDLTCDAYTLLDVAVLEDGLLFGVRYDWDWARAQGLDGLLAHPPEPDFYIDGFRQKKEYIDRVYERDETQPPNDAGEHPVKSTTSLIKVPYYRAAADMPEVLTVYALRHDRKDYDNSKEEIIVMESACPFEMILRVDRRTGAVTLPADDAEKDGWIAATRLLTEDGRNDARDYLFHHAETVNGFTVVIDRLQYYPAENRLHLVAFFPCITCESMPDETPPSVTVDGVPLEKPAPDAYYAALDPSLAEDKPYRVDVGEWMDTYDPTKKRFGWGEFDFVPPARLTELPETFTLAVSWEIFDLNERGERVFRGTFGLETEITRDQYQAFDPEDKGYRRAARHALIEEYRRKGELGTYDE